MLRGLVAGVVATGVLVQPAPTAVVPVSAPVEAFAQDGGRVVWVGGTCSDVHVRVLATGHETVVGENGFGECQTYPVRVALAGRTAMWTNYYVGLNSYTGVTDGWAAGKGHALTGEDGFVSDDIGWGEGPHVVAIAGDGPSLLFAVLDVEIVDDACTHSTTAKCSFALHAGWVQQAVRGRAHRLSGLPPTLQLAVAQDTVALVPPQPGTRVSATLPPEHAVELWSVSHRTLLHRIELDAAPAQVALDRTELAVLVHAHGLSRVERFAVPSGRPLGAAPLAEGARDLSISSSGIVYRTNRVVRLLGRRAPLALAAATPIGLSIESTRVAWAENVNGAGRIRVIHLRP